MTFEIARDRRELLDTTLHAEAPEGIDLLLRPAGVPARTLAYVLDGCLRFVLLTVALIVLGLLGKLGAGLVSLIVFALEWLYPVLFELLPGAATPGKKAMGLQVVLDDGLPITPAASMVRNLLRVADFLPFAFGIGLASMLLRRDFKRVGDIVAGTLVVHRARLGLYGALPPAEAAAPLAPLTHARQVAILHLAGRAARLTGDRVDELARLAEAVLPTPARADASLPSPTSAPAGARLLAVAQWVAGQR